ASMNNAGLLWFEGGTNGGSFYVSDDGGESWSLVPLPPAISAPWDPQTPDVQREVAAVFGDPTSATRALAWGWEQRSSTTGRVPRWFTTDDTGATWTEIGVPWLP